MLWRLRTYWLPGLPSPTKSSMALNPSVRRDTRRTVY
jgi:hypothetical protein